MEASLNWNDRIIRAGVEQLWEDRAAEGYGDWLGFGRCCLAGTTFDCKTGTESDGPPHLLLFMQRQCDISEWIDELVRRIEYQKQFALDNKETTSLEFVSSLERWGAADVSKEVRKLECQCKQIIIGPFRQFQTGVCVRSSTLLRPGARVFSTSPDIGESPYGTIGAFLKRIEKKVKDGKSKDEKPGEKKPRDKKRKRAETPRDAWLLSNKHILLQRRQDLESVEVRGAGQTLISRRVNFVGEKFEENLVDAAVAKVDDPSDIEPFYEGIDISCPCPVEPRPGMAVKKLGNATGVTSGKIICQLDQASIGGAKGSGGLNFVKPWLIGSDDTFVANGDSGALVIGCEHPVALLFAMTDNVDGLSNAMPFGLAISICDVLTEIKKELGFVEDGLEIMLPYEPEDACRYAHLHNQKCCPPPKKCPEENPATQHKQEHKPHK
ncbi:MAG TPA: hypothetical protein VGK01_23025 [Candidatus Angelobacter sp.]|jgi:hypothetical protein